MDIKRIILYVVLFGVGFALWHAWEKDYPPVTATAAEQAAATNVSANVPPTAVLEQAKNISTPPISAAGSPGSTASATSKQTSGNQIVLVKTDVLQVGIDTLGA